MYPVEFYLAAEKNETMKFSGKYTSHPSTKKLLPQHMKAITIGQNTGVSNS